MSPLITLFLLSTGFAGGLIGAMLGLGGGIIIVPLLVLGLDVPMHSAVATSLLCVIATSSAAASSNLRKGLANPRLGITLELSTVLGGIAGGLVAGNLEARTLMAIFGIALLLMVVPLARGRDSLDQPIAETLPDTPRQSFMSQLGGSYFDQADGRQVGYEVRRIEAAVGVSGAAGILSGLLGVGGGIVKVPVMTSFCGVPMKAAAATSNFMIGVTAVASAILYYGRGEVIAGITGATVLGVFAGSRLGAKVASKVRGVTLRRLFAVVMIVVAIQMLLKASGVLES